VSDWESLCDSGPDSWTQEGSRWRPGGCAGTIISPDRTLDGEESPGFYTELVLIKELTLVLLLMTGFQADGRPRFVVLPGSAVKGSVRTQGDWFPTEEDLKNAEQNISQISSLKAENWNSKIHVGHPESYFRQYVPVREAGRKLLYINAFCSEPPKDWGERLVVVSDGGTCFWQVFYDPERQSFAHLTINGRG
jgi:hypothetical protein